LPKKCYCERYANFRAFFVFECQQVWMQGGLCQRRTTGSISKAMMVAFLLLCHGTVFHKKDTSRQSQSVTPSRSESHSIALAFLNFRVEHSLVRPDV